MKEFNFAYFTTKQNVVIDAFTVKIKSGPFLKREFALGNLQHYYVFDNRGYRSLFFLYTDDKGKTKKFQLFSTPAEIGFTQMVAELQSRFPDKGLNHLSEKEAFKVLKTANPKKWAPAVVFLFLFVILSIVLYPGLRHFLDFGFAEAKVEELATHKDLGTRNISVSGSILDAGLEQTTTTTRHGSTSKTTKVYIPLVSENWVKGDPVEVVLKFDELSDGEYQEVLGRETFTGVIRNIAWEGIDDEQVNFFKSNYSLNMPAKPVLVEVTNEQHNDVYAPWALGTAVLITSVILMVVILKKR